MGTTLAQLQSMRDTTLRTCLLPYYNNNVTTYNANVTVKGFSTKPSSTERTFVVLNTTGSTTSKTKVINLVFQDEAQTAYHPNASTFSADTTRTTTYNTDMPALRTTLNDLPNGGYYRGAIFRVNSGPNSFDAFRQFLIAVRDGLGNYSGPNGLSDKPEIKYLLDITPSSTTQYYRDQIILALNTLGYNIPQC
jgi:hypothetical protein